MPLAGRTGEVCWPDAYHWRALFDAHSGSSSCSRGLPKAIHTYNGKEPCGRAMLTWAHQRGVMLFLIVPGKPNQKVYIESFNGTFVMSG